MQATDFEARKERRVISVYRTCYVGTDDQVQFALLRNLSDSGAQIEAEIAAPIGSTVYYSLDEVTRIEAEVRWKKDGRVGLVNRSLQKIKQESFPRRAIRLALRQEAQAWIDGRPYKIKIANISQLGARLIGLPQVPVGKPIFLKLGGIEIHTVTARWVGETAAGVRFPRALAIAELNQILSAEPAPQRELATREARPAVLDERFFNGRAA